MDSLYVILLSGAVVAMAGLLAVSLYSQQPAGPTQDTIVDEGYNVTEDGTKYTVHPSKIQMGCSGKDCIPSIDDPSFESASAADDWLEEGDLVIGLKRDGETKAYPLRILNVHEIVNDRIAGHSVVVTYCPLCRSGLVYSRNVGGQTLEFGVSGRLWNANLVMYDRQTDTFWSQVQGNAIKGKLVPAELDLITSTITEWSKWKQAHPDTAVLSRDTGIYKPSQYDSNPYRRYQNSESVGYGVEGTDDRLHPKEIVYGISIGSEATAYRESTIEDEEIVHDRFGGSNVVLIRHPESGAIKAYRSPREDIRLNWNGTELIDDDGGRWNRTDEGLEHEDGQLTIDELPTHGFFWFAWEAFHPETTVYGE